MCVCVCVFVVCICDVPSRLRGIEINSIRVAYMRARFFLTKDPTKAKRTFALLPIQACSGGLYRKSCSIDHWLCSLVFLLITFLSLGKIRHPSIPSQPYPTQQYKRTCVSLNGHEVSGIDASV